MAPPTAGLDSVFPIVTKLKAEAWELALENAGILSEFADVPVGLRQGFLCGLEQISLACTSVPPNISLPKTTRISLFLNMLKKFLSVEYCMAMILIRFLLSSDIIARLLSQLFLMVATNTV